MPSKLNFEALPFLSKKTVKQIIFDVLLLQR